MGESSKRREFRAAWALGRRGEKRQVGSRGKATSNETDPCGGAAFAHPSIKSKKKGNKGGPKNPTQLGLIRHAYATSRDRGDLQVRRGKWHRPKQRQPSLNRRKTKVDIKKSSSRKNFTPKRKTKNNRKKVYIRKNPRVE